MTLVRFEYTRPTGSGADAPLAGRKLIVSLVNREEVAGRVRVTETFTADLNALGAAVVPLSATAPNQGWKVRESWLEGRPDVVYAVPDLPGAVNAVDLVELDPASLSPGAGPVPAWSAALAALAAKVADIEENGAPAGPPTGGAGGALQGTYPNPGLNPEALRQATSRTFVFDVPAGMWSVTHSLGRRPSVSIFLPSGEEVEADVVATTSTVLVTFPTPTAGVLELS